MIQLQHNLHNDIQLRYGNFQDRYPFWGVRSMGIAKLGGGAGGDIEGQTVACGA